MALDATALAAAIAEFPLPPSSSAYWGQLGDAIAAGLQGGIATAVATAVVAHLQSNAEVLPSGAPAMAAGGDAVTGKGRIQ